MKKIYGIMLAGSLLYGCNGGDKSSSVVFDPDPEGEKITQPGGDVAKYDPNRGTGKFTKVDIAPKLDVAMATGGQKLYETKCSGCHKTTDEKLVGPGWKGVSTRHQPEWLMNFMTNTNEMIEKDPKLQEQLQICLVRMPDQTLADEQARHLLEFMRKNDGVK